MSVAGDPLIRLFGRQIPPQDGEGGSSMAESCVVEVTGIQVKNNGVESSAPELIDFPNPPSSTTLNNDDNDENQKMTDIEEETSEQRHVEKHEQDNTKENSAEEKILKKPDKILPCPRCNSFTTKFCYYNNYNVNQPRHFCKKCQRYWTAGGAMRNLPVGSGKRKNKNSTSHHYHVMIPSDANAVSGTNVPQPGYFHVQQAAVSVPRPVQRSGTLLKVDSEGPLCESMSSVHIGSLRCQKKNEEESCTTSATISNCAEIDHPKVAIGMDKSSNQNSLNGVVHFNNLLCLPGPPWAACTWPMGWNNMASMTVGQCSPALVNRPENGSPYPVPWPPQVMVPSINFPSVVPFPCFPPIHWSHMSAWPRGIGNMTSVRPSGGLSPASSMAPDGCPNNSPKLGKHSRDTVSEAVDKPGKILWFPKTLRIDDPDEAAKSSIWATLGITPGKSLKKGAGIFEGFSSNSTSNQKSDAAQVSHANPAAVARSQTLQEST